MNEPSLNEFTEKLRTLAAIDGTTDETDESVDLSLTKEQFINKMLKEKDGQALLDLLEIGEWIVAERLGLVNGYIENGQVYFTIPRWNNLVQHLKIVNSV